MPDERTKAVEALLAPTPAGKARDRLKARISLLEDKIEQAAGRRNNVAQMTYLLAGMSLQIGTGRTLEPARAQELTRAIDAADAADPAFGPLDDRGRSRIYYRNLTLLATMAALSLSNDPGEARAGCAIAKSTLQSLGITP